MVAIRRDHVKVERIDDEAVVLNTRSNETTALNNVALVVYDCCDEKHDVPGIIAKLNEAGLGPATEDAVYLALRDLSEVELIDVHIGLPDSVSRRSLLKKMATGAAVGAALLPVVETITAPPAYAQGSVPDTPTPMPTTTTIAP